MMNLPPNLHVDLSSNHESRCKQADNSQTRRKKPEVVNHTRHLSENNGTDKQVSQVHRNETNDEPTVTEEIPKIVLDDLQYWFYCQLPPSKRRS
jgi:hypothetical protein